MSRYGDNCEKHDLPYGDCIECVRDDLKRQLKEGEHLRVLIREAVGRLQMPIKQIRGDGFSELMGKLRKI